MDMSTPDVRYEWNNHTSVLRTNCQELMLNDTYSDVTLFTAEGNKIPAHKIILSNASRYFKNIFSHCRRDHPLIIVKDVSTFTLNRLMEFMYVGNTTVPRAKLKPFIEAATALMIEGLSGKPLEKDDEENVKMEDNDNDDNDNGDDDDDDDDVQRKELDLSQNGPTRRPQPMTTPNFSEHRESLIPNLIAAPQAHINRSLIGHQSLGHFDNHIFNTALAMRTNTQYLASQLGSPARASIANQTLPRQSPHKSIADSPKLQIDESCRREPTPALPNIRLSQSPEDSTTSNTSLDLTKASGNNHINRINAVNQSLNNLASHANITVSAAIASQIHHYTQQFKPPIRVSQSLLQSSRSKSPEIVDVQIEDDVEDKIEDQFHENQTSQNISPNIRKQNSSGGGSSSDNNNYSDDSDSENRDQESDHKARSVSPGPSSSTPRIGEALIAESTFRGLPWSYHGCPDEAGKSAADSTGTAGFWKNSFKNSLLAPYLNTPLPPLSPGSHSSTLSPTFPGLYPATSLNSSWGRSSSPPSSLHSMPFLRSNECSRCGRLYKTRKGLKHHIKNECGVEPRFQCTRCDWKFKQKAHLLRHMARKHTPPS